jgi:hypothetical protein
MLSIVPYPKRFTAAVLTAALVAMCAACGSTMTGSAGLIAPVSVGCGLQTPAPGGFAELPGFTVTEICPDDVDPAFATHEFGGLAACVVSQNGNPILKVLVGQLKNGSGDAFIHTYVGKLSDQTREDVGVPSEPAEVDGHVLTHFNIPLQTDGYAYADGQTVVIAYVVPVPPPATVEAALSAILGNV